MKMNCFGVAIVCGVVVIALLFAMPVIPVLGTGGFVVFFAVGVLLSAVLLRMAAALVERISTAVDARYPPRPP